MVNNEQKEKVGKQEKNNINKEFILKRLEIERRMFKEKVAEFTGNMLLKNAEVMPHFHRYSREYGKKFLKMLMLW